ncbi:hypothetical protein K440DRAFT_620960 [Wilcoxina mikolae CBS 423.85]|nr:hypothetical protein K440DRAFT_620960 [Wilcoxina mikolae CBS 423.85]
MNSIPMRPQFPVYSIVTMYAMPKLLNPIPVSPEPISFQYPAWAAQKDNTITP